MKRGPVDEDDDVPPPPVRVPGRWDSPVEKFLTGEPIRTSDRRFWVIRNAIARGVTSMWAGPPNGGKSWGAMDLAICVAAGMPWLGTFDNALGEPGLVLYLALEDTIEQSQARGQALARGHGLSRQQAAAVEQNLIVTRVPLRLPDDERAFAEYIAARRPVLVILDTLAKVFVGDENSTKDAGAFCDSLGRLCTSTSILVLHHTGKDGFGRPGDAKVRGSSALVGHMRHLLRSAPGRTPGTSSVAIGGNLTVTRDRFELGFDLTSTDLGGDVARLTDLTGAAADQQRARAEVKASGGNPIAERRVLAVELAANAGPISVTDYHEHLVEQLGADAVARSRAHKDIEALVEAGLLARSSPKAPATLTEAGLALAKLDRAAIIARLTAIGGAA